jgi:undecaprenyl-diphosphatase
VLVVALGVWVAHRSQPVWPDTWIDPLIHVRPGTRHFAKEARRLGDPLTATGYCVVVVAACVLGRRYRAALLTAIAVPAASALTEFALKPLIDRTIGGYLAFPSGHVTGVSAVAAAVIVALAGPSRPPLPRAARWAAGVLTVVLVVVVATGMVALGDHYATDTAGAAAVSTGMVLATALAIDVAADALVRRRERGARGERGTAPAGELTADGARLDR